MSRFVALLYSIVLSPQRRLVMDDLRDLARQLGFRNPRTLVATGNLVFEADSAPVSELEAQLEAAFSARFGKPVPIIVRRAEDWLQTVAGNPFVSEAALAPRQVHLRIMREPLDGAHLAMLAAYCTRERLALVGGDLWIDFAGPVGPSRLVPVLTPKRLGIGTLRNWNTVRRLGEMAAAAN